MIDTDKLEDTERHQVHAKWAKALSDNLEPYSLLGGYPNTLGPNVHRQIANVYGTNLNRLRSTKKLLDPKQMFSAQPLPLES